MQKVAFFLYFLNLTCAIVSYRFPLDMTYNSSKLE